MFSPAPLGFVSDYPRLPEALELKSGPLDVPAACLAKSIEFRRVTDLSIKVEAIGCFDYSSSPVI